MAERAPYVGRPQIDRVAADIDDGSTWWFVMHFNLSTNDRNEVKVVQVMKVMLYKGKDVVNKQI